MKVLCLFDWPVYGRWIWDYLQGSPDDVDFVWTHAPKDRFPGYGKLFGYYEKYFWLALNAFPKMKRYDIVVAWEGKNGLPLALLRSLTGTRHPPMVILNFVLKGKPVMKALPLVRFALKSVNCLTCLSNGEIKHYARRLRMAASHFEKLQGPFPDFKDAGITMNRDRDYIFAAGRSHRDYGSLIEAVRGLPLRLIINARAFNVTGLTIPANVTISPFVPFPEFLSVLRGCRFAVLPLAETDHASGETFMMQAMSMSKTVIATETFSTSELIDSGVNGMLVPCKDVQSLRCAIQMLMDNTEVVERMGSSARENYVRRCSFPSVAPRMQRILRSVVDEAQVKVKELD